MPDLLWEIGTEEMPAGYLAPATESLGAAFKKECDAGGVAPAEVRTDATPRRLALFARGLPAQQPGREAEVKGPPASAAFGPDKAPTRAAEAFAAKNGVPVSALTIRETEKGPYVYCVRREGGAAIRDLLPAICQRALAAVATPKSMTWGAGVTFARPIRSICLLLDGEVVPATLAGVAAGRTVRGHPFLAPGPVTLTRADWDAYRDALKRVHVVLETDERRRLVYEGVWKILRSAGDQAQPDADLVAEVANLLEWPTAIEGSFDAEFLAVPEPVLVAAMTEHQRYFPVRGPDGRLVNRFVTVADRDGGHDPLIRSGNERVLRARLADARFFFAADRERKLADRVADLSRVGTQEGLGSLRERAERLAAVACTLTQAARAPTAIRGLPVAQVQAAARLAKADLTTQVVGEFPSLQGTMGAIYAALDGDPASVAAAIREHYLPRGAGDALPREPLALLLAVADRALLLAEGFALGRGPTGSRDPYGLRRAALGLLRLVREGLGAGRLSGLLHVALAALPAGPIREAGEKARAALLAFCAERLAQTALDAGFRHDAVRAVAAAGSDEPVDFFQRLEALGRLRAEAGFQALVEVVDRTRRIVGEHPPRDAVTPALLREPAEQAVHAALAAAAADVRDAFARRAYVDGAHRYRDALATPVHAFFEQVFVNVDDPAVRGNRLALCWQVHRLFAEGFADLGTLEGAAAPAGAR